MAPTSLSNPSSSHYPIYDAFPEGFVFECPYHPGGPLSVATHRGYLGALRATVHCTHHDCHFSAYDDGSVSSASQCPTARVERDRDGVGHLKPGTHIPFHCLIYRRRWSPHQADSRGRVVIPADVDPVVERSPGAPVPCGKTPNVLQSPAKTIVGATHINATTTNEPSIPSNTEDRGSSCFGNSIRSDTAWMKSHRSMEENERAESKGKRDTPLVNVTTFVENFGKEELHGKEHSSKHTVRPIPPPRAKPPHRNAFEIVDWPQKSSDLDDFVNVPRSPEKDNVPRRFQTLRNIQHRDDGSNAFQASESVTSCSTDNSDNAPHQDKHYPDFFPGAAHKPTQLRDFRHQASSAEAGVPDTRDAIFTLRFNPERGTHWGIEPRAEEAAPDCGGVVDDLSADSIANLVLRLADIPERLNSLEKVNEAIAKSNDAKNVKIKHLEEAAERSNLREKELEDIIATYEQIGRRHQFSSLA